MKDFKIITDSCSDMPKDLREKYDIDYVKMQIVVDGKELPASLDWDIYSPKELYDIMRGGKRITTTQVPNEEFTEVFGKYLEQGMDVLYIGCSSALSGSVNAGLVIARELEEKYDAKIVCIDCLNSCYAEASIAIKAAELKAEGRSLEETAGWIEENKLKFNQAATVESLDYLRRAGRVKATAAFFGNIFGVKPIIISDAHGNNYAIKKVKGRKGSIAELVNMAKETIEDPENQTLYVCHADCMDDAVAFKDALAKEIPCKDIYVGYIGPIIGASTGPGTIAVYYYGKEVTVVGE